MSSRQHELDAPGRIRDPQKVVAHRLRKKLLGMALRWHVAIILLLTALSAPAFAKGMKWLGIDSMPLRFSLVVAGSYVVFLLLIRLWVWMMTPSSGSSEWKVSDAADLALDGVEVAPDLIQLGRSASSRAAHASTDAASGLGEAAGGLGEAAGALFDGEGVVVAIVLALVAVVLLSLASAGIYLLWIGPELLVEAAIASLLATGLSKHPEAGGAEHWLEVAVGRTWWIALLVGIGAAGIGAYLQTRIPEAQTLSEALRHLLGPR